MVVKKKEMTESSIQFMIAEFNRIQSAETCNRNSGDTRVNLYLTLVSLIGVGIAAFWQLYHSGNSSTVQSFYIIAIIAFLFLSLIGIIILRLLLERWHLSIIFLRKLARIRQFFVDIDENIKPYLVYSTDDTKPSYISKGFLSSSLTTLVIVLNSVFITFTVSFLIQLIPLKINLYILISVILICLSSVFIIQRRLLMKAMKKYESDKHSAFPSPNIAN